MRIKFIESAVVAALAAALTVGVSPSIAQAAPDGGTQLRISEALSQSKLLAAGAVAIRNEKSKKFLRPGSSANNSVVTQQPFDGNALLGWSLINDAGFTTFNNTGVNRNLGTSGASTASNTSAVIVNGSGSFDQDWFLKFISDTQFRLQNRKDTSKCLGIDGASTANGARAAIFACDNTNNVNNQAWSLFGVQ